MTIHIEISAEMLWEPSLAELWPDGDHPEKITADDVVSLINRCGGVRRAMRDWNLLDDLGLEVVVSQVNPEWQGDNVLFGDPPPRLLITTARVEP